MMSKYRICPCRLVFKYSQIGLLELTVTYYYRTISQSRRSMLAICPILPVVLPLNVSARPSAQLLSVWPTLWWWRVATTERNWCQFVLSSTLLRSFTCSLEKIHFRLVCCFRENKIRSILILSTKYPWSSFACGPEYRAFFISWWLIA